MSEERTVAPNSPGGVLRFAPLIAITGWALVVVLPIFLPVDERGDNFGRAALIALAVGVSVYASLWWFAASPGAADLARRWRADDPDLYTTWLIWGIATITTLAVLLLSVMSDAGAVGGMLMLSFVAQAGVMMAVGRHILRGLDRRYDEKQADATIKRALAVVGGPLTIYLFALLFFDGAVFTGDNGGDWLFAFLILAPLTVLMLLIGFAVVYGPGEALGRTWSALSGKSAA